MGMCLGPRCLSAPRFELGRSPKHLRIGLREFTATESDVCFENSGAYFQYLACSSFSMLRHDMPCGQPTSVVNDGIDCPFHSVVGTEDLYGYRCNAS